MNKMWTLINNSVVTISITTVYIHTAINSIQQSIPMKTCTREHMKWNALTVKKVGGHE